MNEIPRPSPFISAPRASIILRPGIRTLPAGTERYRIAGGGSLVVEVKAGDEITVTDIEGLQACELVTAGSDGRIDAGLLGARANSKAEGLKAMLASGGATAAALARRGIDLGKAEALRIFGAGSRPGAKASFKIARDGVLIAAAPGGVMDAELQDTATDLELVIRRAVAPVDKNEQPLPEPLADPSQDIRIRAATAQAYVVKAGEFIQVIDVAGRQCTDFQCFSARKLDKGVENALDATISRALSPAGAIQRPACRRRPLDGISNR